MPFSVLEVLLPALGNSPKFRVSGTCEASGKDVLKWEFDETTD